MTEPTTEPTTVTASTPDPTTVTATLSGTPPQTAPAKPGTDSNPEPAKVEDLPAWAQKTIRDLRQENGDTRAAKTTVETERQQMLDGIAKALGLKSDDTPPDPAALQQTITDREGKVAALETTVADQSKELAAWRVAALEGVNAASLMDSRTFLNEINKLDPTADDFATKLKTAITHAVEVNPTLRGTVVPPAGHAGIGATGQTGTAPSTTPGLGTLRQAYGTK